MGKRKNKNCIEGLFTRSIKLISIIFIILFIPLLSIQSDGNFKVNENLLIQETINYQFSEYFTNTSYKNVTMTNATGWGDSNLSIPLKGFGEPIFIDTNVFTSFHFFVKDNLTYIADAGEGFSIINTSDFNNPEIITQIDDSDIPPHSGVNAIYAQNDFIYLGQNGLTVINISDPSNPDLSKQFHNTIGSITDLYVQGDYAFMTYGSGLTILNISSPSTVLEFHTRPAIYKATSGNSYNQRLYIQDDLVYLTESSGLSIINISDPLNPSDPTYVDLEGNPVGVAVQGDYAYVAVGSSGLAVVNISDPLNPSDPIYYDTEYSAYDVHITDGIAFVATGVNNWVWTGKGSFVAFYAHDPTILGTKIESHGNFTGSVLSSDGYAYYTTAWGLSIFEIEDFFSFNTPALAQTTSIYGGTGFIQNINVRANQTIYPNTSISHYISTDENTWIPITLNETLSFSTNDTHDFFWRAVLDTDNSTKSPVINSILIEYEVYYDETTTTTTETTTTETTTEPITTEESTTTTTDTTTEPITTEEPTTTISSGETKNCDFSVMNEFNLLISTTLSSASTQLELNNLQTGLALQITISPRLGQTFTLFSISKTQSEIDWQLIDSQGHVRLSETQSNVETITKSITIDTSGSWRLVFHWENSIQPMIFDCNVKQVINPSNIPDIFFPLSILMILLSAFGFVLYKTITVWSKEWKKELKPRPEKSTSWSKPMLAQWVNKQDPESAISKTPIETPKTIKKQIVEYSPEPKERRSFFCQLDNAQHPKTDSGFQCENCSRMVCAECYEKSLEVGVPECPFCDGTLIRIQ